MLDVIFQACSCWSAKFSTHGACSEDAEYTLVMGPVKISFARVFSYVSTVTWASGVGSGRAKAKCDWALGRDLDACTRRCCTFVLHCEDDGQFCCRCAASCRRQDRQANKMEFSWLPPESHDIQPSNVQTPKSGDIFRSAYCSEWAMVTFSVVNHVFFWIYFRLPAILIQCEEKFSWRLWWLRQSQDNMPVQSLKHAHRVKSV